MKRMDANKLQLLNFLKIYQKISLQDAMNLTDASESTVRRLFLALEKSGICLRYYGGLRLISNTLFSSDYFYEEVEQKNIDAKLKIASIAVSMVEKNDVIYIDSGSTVARFAAKLAEKFQSESIPGLTIFTNSLVNLNLLQKLNINLIGGNFRESRKDFCGYLAEESLKLLQFTKCFLGTDGFSKQKGFSTTDFSTARLNEIVMHNSQKRYVLMDSSKFFTSSVISYSGHCVVDAIITEKFPQNEFPETTDLNLPVITEALL